MLMTIFYFYFSRINIFLRHAKRCLFDVHIERLRERLNSASHYSQIQMHARSQGRSPYSAGCPSTSPPHPSLINAIYLVACHFANQDRLAEMLGHIVSKPGPGSSSSSPNSSSPSASASSSSSSSTSKLKDCTQYEAYFLARSLRGISASLEYADRLVDAVRASALLAVYFFSKARLLEGYYHSSSAARLAVSLGLHQIAGEPLIPGVSLTPPATVNDLLEGSTEMQTQSQAHAQLINAGMASTSASLPMPMSSYDPLSATAPIHAMMASHHHQSGWAGVPAPTVPLPPAQDIREHNERIEAFWQVFCVDRFWSVATGLPTSLPDDDHPQLRIYTLWPRAVSEYTPVSSFAHFFNDFFPFSFSFAEGVPLSRISGVLPGA